MIRRVKVLVKNNKKIVENYIFMTVLQILNSFFHLLIYPYLIKSLGTETYGVFVYVNSITAIALIFVNFGFDLPATKQVAHDVNDKSSLSQTLSCIFTAKNYLFIITGLVLWIIVGIIPSFSDKKEYFLLSFISLYSFVLFPQWFFQGIQKMSVVTYVQLGVKLFSLPLIFIFIKKPEDIILYFFIIGIGNILGGLWVYIILRWQYKIKISFVSLNLLKRWFFDGFPFFCTNLIGALKESIIPIITGNYFGMREVAVYDLANKIIGIPRVLSLKINDALFPKLVVENDKKSIFKIIKIEYIYSFIVILLIIAFGKYAVNILSNGMMENAYWVCIALSFTILSWLVVGAYINFVFVPQKKYYIITLNQLVAILSFILYTYVGLFFNANILVLAIAMSLSGITEILFCSTVSSK